MIQLILLRNTEKLTLKQLSSDEVLNYAICFKFIQISLSTSKLSEDFKLEHLNIPWTKISGLRNIIVHDYGNVKMEIILDTDLPLLLPSLKKIIT